MRSKQRTRLIKHDYQITKKFGINRPTYDLMLEEQDHTCYICGQEDKEGQLAVDHDHTTKKVRGLLCRQCNRGLGMFKDDLRRLKKAVEYLTREYTVPVQPDIPRIAQTQRARWRNIVKTPNGTFASFSEAGVYYDVHPTTIGGWCGKYKGTIKEGFSCKRLFSSNEEAQLLIRKENDKNK